MIFCIVKKEPLSVRGYYESVEAKDTSAHWDYSMVEPFCAHIPVPEGLDPDCVKAISFQETITVEDAPAVPEVPESINPMTGEVIPGTPAVEAVTHEEQVSRYDLEIDPALVEAKSLRVKEQRKQEKLQRFNAKSNADFAEALGVDSPELVVADLLMLLDLANNPSDYVDAADPEMDSHAKVLAHAKNDLKEYRKVLKKRLKKRKELNAELSVE